MSYLDTAAFLQVLDRIVTESISLGGANIDKVSRWIRCLLQKSLLGDFDRAENLVKQVMILGSEKESLNKYPQDELEWLAASLWNLAIDKNCAGDVSESKKWAEYALSIAGLLSDGGDTERMLQSKFVTLQST